MFIGIGMSVVRGGSIFSPLLLFAAGQQGVWYDPSDINTLFQDSMGTTPVTGFSQPIGLVLDKSQGLASGPQLITNGNFASGTTGWSSLGTTTPLSASGGVLTIIDDGGDGTTARAYQAVAGLTVGGIYRVSATIRGVAGSATFVISTSTATGGAPFTSTTSQGTSKNIVTTFIATATTMYVICTTNTGAGSTAQLSAVSMTAVAGNHASQATSGLRPLYARYPTTPMRNLLVYSSDMSNAAWVKNGTTTVAAAGENSPLGNPAWQVTYTGTTNVPLANRNRSAKAGETYTISAWIKAGTAPNLIMRLSGGSASGSLTVTPTSTWTRYTVTGTVVTDTTAFGMEFRGSTTAAGTILVADAQLELGTTTSAFQEVLAAGVVNEPLYRNVAGGSADVANNAVWSASVLQNGITATKVGSGTGADGLPYVDIQYTGTASSTTHNLSYVTANSYTPATVGTWVTGSFLTTQIAGTTTGVTGICVQIAGRDSANAALETTSGVSLLAPTETLSTATLVMANALTVKASGGVIFQFVNGATIDVTYRVKALQLEYGSNRTAYQANTNAYDITEAGLASKVGFRYDGIDDFLQTPTITHTSDKVQFFAGLTKTSDATRATVFIQSGGSGRVSLEAPGGTLNNYSSANGGTTLVGLGPVIAAPNTSVISVQSDIAAPSTTFRRNGAVSSTSVATMGTGNFPSGIMYIGASSGSVQPFSGFLDELIVRFGDTLTAADITNTETWVNSKTVAY